MHLAGASEGFTSEIVRRVCERGEDGKHPLDVAAEEIGASFAVAKAGLPAATTAVMAFVGPTGVGKTTTIAKLAARLIRSGRRVAVATLDAYRVGAVQQWHAYGKLLRVPVHVLRDASQLLAQPEVLRGLDALLVDTSGRVAQDIEQLALLRDGLARAERAARFDSYLVLSAVNSRASLAGLTESAVSLVPSGCVISKLDETSGPAPALEHARSAELPFAFLSDGPDIARDFHRASPELFADLFLSGRLR
jgi:flagellar biosynthesis protein FlhF